MKILLVVLMAISISAKGQLSCTSKVTVNFNYTGTVQTWTVPAGITSITTKTKGASGGLATAVANSTGGGAVIEADYTVIPGQLVTIIVGGRGGNGDNESGGGGSTAVYINGVLKLVAGGGGGEDNTGNGGVGVFANNGINGSPINTATACPADDIGNSKGGTSGNGGNAGEICAANINGGGGGGGLNSVGGGKTGNYGGGGQGSIIGSAGGGAGTGGAAGGWGWSGGGGADDRESGGGGGYSGGGGGGESGFPGGGGSFSDATGRTALFTANGILTTTAQDGLVTICYNSTLGLILQSFTGRSESNYNIIQWKTADEFNIEKFIIEKSVDGNIFYTIGDLAATNNGTGKTYEFRDNSLPGNTTYYYRLRIIESGRIEKFSSIIHLRKNDLSEKFTFYPNPVMDNLLINCTVPIKKIEIITLSNIIVYTSNAVNLTNSISVKSFPNGLYVLKVYTESETILKRFIKH